MLIATNVENIDFSLKFSVCTLVSKKEEYTQMLDSFEKAGFSPNDTEFIYIDNCNGNSKNAFVGINEFLTKAKGKYIIVCHQDIILIDTKADLERNIENIEKNDTNWAILGNAGSISIKKHSKYFINGYNILEHINQVPSKVMSLDENFLIFNHKTNLGLSANLSDFHFYGADACLMAQLLGYNCYTIPFLLKHISFGNMNRQFWEQKRKIIKEYKRKCKSQFVQTPCTYFYYSSSNILTYLFNTKIGLFFIKEYFKRKYSLNSGLLKLQSIFKSK